ncbi:membrane protein PM19L-like [Bidens hawaiensis]|uniref:membrane protein PM19L-like n=1 Tax=Bidens hawaiensis TaxID=980011 RepID=UPI00404B92CC
MGLSGAKPATFFFFFMNLALYLLVIVITSLEVNLGIRDSHKQASVLTIPARIFPIYYPFGNMATGYVVILSLLAGVVGFTTSITGWSNAAQPNASKLYAAFASSLITWSLALLAMGFACKEKSIGWTGDNLNVLESLLTILSGTQLLGLMAIHVEIEELVRFGGGLV